MNTFKQLLSIFPNATQTPTSGDYEWYETTDGLLFALPINELTPRERHILSVWAHPYHMPSGEQGLWQGRLLDETFLLKEPFRLISLALTYQEREALDSLLDVLRGFFEESEIITTSDFRIDILEQTFTDMQEIEEMMTAVGNDLYMSIRIVYSERSQGALAPLFKLHERLLPLIRTSTKAYPASQVFYQELLKETITQEEKKQRTLDVFNLLDDTSIQILEAFFKHTLNVSNTAKALFMHRNTLNYRLDRLFDATGYDVRQFYDAALLYLIITLHKSD